MQNKKTKIVLTVIWTTLVALFVLMLVILACRQIPLSPDKAMDYLQDNREDIDRITEYFIAEGQPCAFINEANGKIFLEYDFEWHEITDESVNQSVRRLWDRGCENIMIDRSTVSFQLWHRFDDECGIAIPVDQNTLPTVQYLTDREALTDGWYYYRADYEKWRTQN